MTSSSTWFEKSSLNESIEKGIGETARALSLFCDENIGEDSSTLTLGWNRPRSACVVSDTYRPGSEVIRPAVDQQVNSPDSRTAITIAMRFKKPRGRIHRRVESSAPRCNPRGRYRRTHTLGLPLRGYPSFRLQCYQRSPDVPPGKMSLPRRRVVLPYSAVFRYRFSLATSC